MRLPEKKNAPFESVTWHTASSTATDSNSNAVRRREGLRDPHRRDDITPRFLILGGEFLGGVKTKLPVSGERPGPHSKLTDPEDASDPPSSPITTVDGETSSVRRETGGKIPYAPLRPPLNSRVARVTSAFESVWFHSGDSRRRFRWHVRSRERLCAHTIRHATSNPWRAYPIYFHLPAQDDNHE